MGAMLPYMELVGFPEKPSQVVRYLRTQPVSPGEWLALVRRQSKELTIREAAVELDVSPARVHHLCAQGALTRTRRGFVSTRSLYNHVAKQAAEIERRTIRTQVEQ